MIDGNLGGWGRGRQDGKGKMGMRDRSERRCPSSMIERTISARGKDSGKISCFRSANASMHMVFLSDRHRTSLQLLELSKFNIDAIRSMLQEWLSLEARV